MKFKLSTLTTSTCSSSRSNSRCCRCNSNKLCG